MGTSGSKSDVELGEKQEGSLSGNSEEIVVNEHWGGWLQLQEVTPGGSVCGPGLVR